MATERQIAANRKNAQHSTGPRTPRGKSVASRNNTRHGLYSSSPVIPRLESQEAWAEHQQATLDSLAPDGPVEQLLAERIALILWRLGRVARYEHTITTHAQQQAEDDLATEHTDPDSDIQAVRAAYAELRRTERAFDRYRQCGPTTSLTGAQAHIILTRITARLPDLKLAAFSLPGLLEPGQNITETPGWTIGRVRKIVEAIARASDRTPGQLVQAALTDILVVSIEVRGNYERTTRNIQKLRTERIVPEDTRLEHIIRFETHLSRQLTQTLAQLQQLQRRRTRHVDGHIDDPNPIN